MLGSTHTLRLRHLMQAVASDVDDIQKLVEKSFEWEHSRHLELGKWMLAASSAIIAVIASGIIVRKDAPIFIVGVIAAASGIFMVLGIGYIWLAASISRRYVVTSSLISTLLEIKPFLQKLKYEGLL